LRLRLRLPPGESHPAVTREHDADAQDRAEMGFDPDATWLTPAVARQWQTVVYPFKRTHKAVRAWREYLEKQAESLAAGHREEAAEEWRAFREEQAELVADGHRGQAVERLGHVVRAERLAQIAHDERLLGPVGLEEQPALYCNLPPGEDVEMSLAKPARFWASVFSRHPNHTVAFLKSGAVLVKQISARKWTVAIRDIPAHRRDACRRRT
jgi:hypothetical protein